MSDRQDSTAVPEANAEPKPTPPVEFSNLMNPPKEPREHRVIAFLPNWIKNEFLAMVSEFVGTTMFLIFAFGATNVANAPAAASGATTVTATGANTSQLLYISLAFGFSLTVNAWVFFRISGGLFNPAVSFALALIGSITWLRAVLLTIAQILGAIAASAIIDALTPGELAVKVALGGGISTAQGLFLEMFLTAELVFTIIMLAAEKHRATFIAPIGIGLALFIAEMFGVYYTGGALNPARALGPAVVIGSFNHYHWIYWLGPYLGATLAAGFYALNKFLKYDHVNPGQDDDGNEIAQEVIRVLESRNAISGARRSHQEGERGTNIDADSDSDLRHRHITPPSQEKHGDGQGHTGSRGAGLAPAIDGRWRSRDAAQMV